ncbi:MAG: VOC family protein [Woeseiaceae bacterium]|nr:VOC family protein [Woeseiaceae bacterium]
MRLPHSGVAHLAHRRSRLRARVPAPTSSSRCADGEVYAEVQQVEHASRVHLDIEADDIEAEVRRLEGLGARRIADIKTWCVMEAPTGQRFCVVPVVSKDFNEKARQWD